LFDRHFFHFIFDIVAVAGTSGQGAQKNYCAKGCHETIRMGLHIFLPLGSEDDY
jgi:hypothetical protein